MNKKLPPLNWLRSFEASARHLNFTHAAQELHLTQAAISKQVKNLEHRLGVNLFTRLPSGLQLTESGAAYLPPVRDAIEQLAAATDELFGFSGAKSLTVHASLIFFSSWLAPKLVEFHHGHPQIDLRFTSSIWVDEHEMLEDIDLEIRYGRGDWPNLITDRLTWDYLLPVCSPSLLEKGPPLQKPADLASHKLLHVAGYEHGWQHWLRKHGCGEVVTDTGIQFDTLIAATEVAAHGLGVALGRSSLLGSMIDQGRLVTPLQEKVETDEAFYLVCSQRPESGSHAAQFRDWIIKTANNLRSGAPA